MHDLDPSLTKWLRPKAKKLDRATLGQLLTLMNLVGAESVAEVGRQTKNSNSLTDAGVNSRQKLSRLEDALQIDITKRIGKCTRPTPAGIRVAGEFRLFLQELRNISTRKADTPTWIIGAGDAWLQSVIIPALAKVTQSHPEWRWEIRNLRATDVRAGLSDGLLHFGFVREAEISTGVELTVGTRVRLESYKIIVGNAPGAPKTAKELVRWVLSNKRPLVQQGSSWSAIREQLGKAVGMEEELAKVTLQIVCISHPQAITAVEAGNAWCVVPSGLGRNLPSTCHHCLVKVGPTPDIMALVHYPRALRKHADSERAGDALRDAIREVARTL